MSAAPPAPMAVYALVGLGSALGGALRWQLAVVLAGAGGWPWATLLTNTGGSLLIGLYAALVGTGGRLRAGPLQQQFVLAGLCGGFTTFSVFSLEALSLWQAQQRGPALAYVLVSLAAWLAAVWTGLVLGRALNARGHDPGGRNNV